MRELALYLVVYRDANHSSRNEMLVTLAEPRRLDRKRLSFRETGC